MISHEEPAEKKPQKSQLLILEQTEETALTELKRNATGLSLSAFTAGLDLGFSVMMMMVVYTLFHGYWSEPAVETFVANMYPIGFILVILGRSELYTEHATLAMLPVLQGLASVKKLFRLWGLVFLFNIIGGLLFALLLSYCIGELKFLKASAIAHLVEVYLDYSPKVLLLTAILSGWLMGLLAWLVTAARETISQLFIIWLITAAYSLAGLPHCIIGNIEMGTQLFLGEVSFWQYLKFLGPVTFGNTIGGVIFVAVLKFAHIMRSGTEKKVDLSAEVEKKSSV